MPKKLISKIKMTQIEKEAQIGLKSFQCLIVWNKEDCKHYRVGRFCVVLGEKNLKKCKGVCPLFEDEEGL